MSQVNPPYKRLNVLLDSLDCDPFIEDMCRANGKAKRFIQALLRERQALFRERAYVRPYASSQERRAQLCPYCTSIIASGHIRASAARLRSSG